MSGNGKGKTQNKAGKTASPKPKPTNKDQKPKTKSESKAERAQSSKENLERTQWNLAISTAFVKKGATAERVSIGDFYAGAEVRATAATSASSLSKILGGPGNLNATFQAARAINVKKIPIEKTKTSQIIWGTEVNSELANLPGATADLAATPNASYKKDVYVFDRSNGHLVVDKADFDRLIPQGTVVYGHKVVDGVLNLIVHDQAPNSAGSVASFGPAELASYTVNTTCMVMLNGVMAINGAGTIMIAGAPPRNLMGATKYGNPIGVSSEAGRGDKFALLILANWLSKYSPDQVTLMDIQGNPESRKKSAQAPSLPSQNVLFWLAFIASRKMDFSEQEKATVAVSSAVPASSLEFV